MLFVKQKLIYLQKYSNLGIFAKLLIEI